MDASLLFGPLAGFFSLGLLVGTLGTLIGAGGGFLMMPVFFFLYPEEPAEKLTALSLAVVFFNAASGSVAYARSRRIDYRAAAYFALCGLPGAWLGTWLTPRIQREVFDPLFGALLIAVATSLLIRKKTPAGGALTVPTGGLDYPKVAGGLLSAGVGLISSLLGIGGGIIHVPAMVHWLGFPVHLATATSHFILMILTGVASLSHLLHGALDGSGLRVAALAPGVILGAQLGAQLSHRIHGPGILRALAVALGLVGVRLLVWR